MTIRRVILEADAADPIFFLLTAYIEATHFYVMQNAGFARLMHLPLGGMDDIRARLTELKRLACDALLDENGIYGDMLDEAIDIFSAAFNRLQFLAWEKQRQSISKAGGCQIAVVGVKSSV
ncbi:MAG: hypothetical protein Q8L40_04640 [Burkholderiales bacterium]|nr:hypothetical protein [Burkholderiales bacterium]